MNGHIYSNSKEERRVVDMEEDSDRACASAPSGGDRHQIAKRIPFFGSQDAVSTRQMASHLEHRIEEYKQDLVNVVQGLDLIVTKLEEAAAQAGKGERDMPGEGVRRLAAKLKRKLDKTPPRWQVNTDVLSWLLRPVPFVAGLPAPVPVPAPITPSSKKTPSNAPNAAPYPPGAVANGEARSPPAVAAAVAEVRGADVGGGSSGLNMLCRAAEEGRCEGDGGVAPSRSRVDTGEGGGGGGAPDPMVLPEEAGEEEVRAERGKKKGGGTAVPVGEGKAAAAAAAVVGGSEERRAVPVVRGPAAECAEALGKGWVASGGGDGGDGRGSGREQERSSSSSPSSGRTGFHSYDETHQIFTHLLRDWTSEGDSVRAAVYDPVLQALDLYVGWQEDVSATSSSSSSSSSTSSTSSTSTSSSSYSPGAAGGGDSGGGGGRAGSAWRGHEVRASKKARRTANVLVPGAGLGRLAAEMAARGYASVHANELSPTMLASCYWLMDALRGDNLCAWDGNPKTVSSGKEHRGNGNTWIPPVVNMVDCDDDAAAGLGGGSGGDGGGASVNGGGGGGSWSGAGSTSFKRGSYRGDDAGRSDGGDFASGKRCFGDGSGGGGGGGGGGDGGTSAAKGFFEFYPFLNDVAHNEMDGEARFRSVVFPDPDGRALLSRASGRLSFQAGEFSATYGAVGGPFEGAFDAVVTSFFVDTAPNVVEYVATIRRTLRSGGVWINCGPLHWHNRAALALSLDEMLALVAGSGFKLEAVERLPPCAYRVADSARSLRVDEFKPVFWVAVVEGASSSSRR